MNPELLKSFKESPYIGLIKDYIQEQIDKMSDVSSHLSWDEVLGKQFSVRILKDFIRQLEQKGPKEKTPNQYK